MYQCKKCAPDIIIKVICLIDGSQEMDEEEERFGKKWDDMILTGNVQGPGKLSKMVLSPFLQIKMIAFLWFMR